MKATSVIYNITDQSGSALQRRVLSVISAGYEVAGSGMSEEYLRQAKKAT